MVKKKKYVNVLDNPLNEFSRDIVNDLREREIKLFEAYGLERPPVLPNNARLLIAFLAKDLGIIGFTPSLMIKKPGKPSKWHDTNGLLFWIKVNLYKERHPTASLREAINNIRLKQHLPNSLNSLYSRYNELNKSTMIKLTYSLIDYAIQSPDFTCTTKEQIYNCFAATLESEE